MTIDVKRIQPGDEVWLKGVVIANDGSDDRPIHVRSDGVAPMFWVGPECLIQHIPRAPRIGKGDLVRLRLHPRADEPWRVIAIDGDEAWLQGEDTRFTAKLGELERVS